MTPAREFSGRSSPWPARDKPDQAGPVAAGRTLQERICAARRWRAEELGQRLFWHCLHRRAVLLAPVVRLFDAEYFAPDRELLARAAGTRSLRQLREEIRDFTTDPRNERWLRQHGRVRVSTRRLQRLARECMDLGRHE